MKKPCLKLFLLSILIAGSSILHAAHELVFESTLSGAQEVTTPPGGIVTDTAGHVPVKFDQALTQAEFRITVRNGAGITQAHFHCSAAGVNGPVVAFLFGPVAAPGVDVEEGTAEGTLDNSDIIPADDEACDVPLNNIASLAFAILSGKIYANVHNTAFPAGVVRGQLLPAKVVEENQNLDH